MRKLSNRLGFGVDLPWRVAGFDLYTYVRHEPQRAQRSGVWLLAVGQTIGYAGLFYIFAALLLTWDSTLDWGKERLTLAFMIAIFVSAAVSPVAGRFVDRGATRWLLSGGMVIGALALFGEKYGEEVRVVAMGVDGNQAYSTELCGGTHVRRTGDIGYFKVLTEGAVAAGVRRIEAVTGPAAENVLAAESAGLAETAAILKVAPADVPSRVGALMDERRKLEKELADARRALATGGGSAASDAKEIAGIKFTGKALDGVPPRELKSMADDLKGQVGSGVVALITANDGKASLVVGVTDDLTDKLSAVDLVRAGSEAVGGKGGGGRPDMAQAGGPDGSKANAALTAIEEAIAGSL